MAQIAGKINSTSRANPTIHLHSVQKLRFLRCARTRRVSRPSQLPGHETRRVDPRLRIIPLKMAIFPRGWRRGRLQRGDSELLWSRSVKQPRLDPAHGSRTAARRKPGIEINFRESVRRTRRPPARPRLSVLFAESLSLREIQSRARPRAPPRPPPTLPPYPRVFSFDSRARACARVPRSHTRSRRMASAAAMHTRYRSAFLRGMSTRYRTLIEERRVHNYARRA